MTSFGLVHGTLTIPFAEACARLDALGFPAALWEKRLDAWPVDERARQSIANRLGWLDALDFITPELARLRAFATEVRQDGFGHVVLLGMGGSSLAAEVLHQLPGVAPHYPRFSMLDSVDPDAVRAAMADADSTLFIVASKSGSTIESAVLAAEAERRVKAAGHANWGSRFAAITDEGSPLHHRARDERFRAVFLNPSTIGGRFSALSFFGLVPAALMGIDLEALVGSAREMERACRTAPSAENPALSLGALIAAGAQRGRDKLTLLLPGTLQAFGLWLEQLIAESTGKEGKGVIPITGEPAGASLGSDRLAVAVSLDGHEPDAAALEQVRAAGVPMTRLHVPSATAIGAEFLRWEIATAAAGALMGINPFDEPNVQQAKDATRALLAAWRRDARLPLPHPDAAFDGVRVAITSAARDGLDGAPALSLLTLLRPADYFALLAYLPPGDAPLAAPLLNVRKAVNEATGCATMFGFGPRYLHSTGQLHKGGPNTGVFIIVTAPAEADLAIPGEPFSFGVLALAQAIGDFESLDRAGRRAMLVSLPRRNPDALQRVAARLLEAL